MTTAPTPSDVERLARGLEEGFCGHAAWLQPAAAELRRQQAEVESLRAERDEADRRAGAAERSAAAFHEDNQRFEQVRRRMKEQWGVHDNVSFDLVWQQALDAKQTLAELEARKPLPLSDEQLRAEFIPWAEIQYRHEDEFTARDFKICLAAWSAGRRAALVDKSPNLQEPQVDKTANLQDRPASLIASREVVADGPVCVTRLNLTDDGRAALTSKAAGPLPGITGGSS